MGDLWGWFLLVGQIVVPVTVLGAGLWFLAKVLRPRPPQAGGAAPGPAARTTGPTRPHPVDPAASRAARRAAVTIAVSGFCLPWVVGLAVKTWLDAHGAPTYPLSSFLAPTAVVVLVAATVGQWCWPFLLLAGWVGSRHFPRFAPRRSFGERLLLARVTHLAGLAGGVAVFVPVFREWDTIYVLVPLGTFLLVPMAGGYGLGILALRRRDARGPSSR